MGKRVLTVGCQIPGNLGEYVSFYSERSLLDADFVIFYPTFFRLTPYSDFSDAAAVKARLAIHHWRREINAAFKAGITIFMMLSASENAPPPNGDLKNYSVFDYIFGFPLHSYLAVSEGTSMILASGESLLREYWRQFGNESQYRVYMENLHPFKPLVISSRGGRVVGGIYRNEGAGALVALPWLDLYRDELCERIRMPQNEDPEFTWKTAGEEWGRRYINALVALDDVFQTPGHATPIPSWAQNDSFKTAKEIELSQTLLAIESERSTLNQRHEKLKEDMGEATSLKALLFEQGRALEKAVREAMSLMGFKASTYRDSDSEFDAVLECPEGRCIGEVEGRDSKAINIDKIRQLNSNIGEDFEREEVSEPAKAVLFGNAYRLTPPSERPAEHFTAKCVNEARRIRAALVRTSDLFEVAKALADHPNPNFATLCRKAILATEGEVVQFPSATNAELTGR